VEFNPNGVGFDFSFNKNECEEIEYGICPLKKYEAILNRKDFDFESERYQFPLCICIFFGLRDKTFKRLPPQLVLFDCGHYGFIDGRHRVCVAQRRGLKLEVTVEKVSSFCDNCN
jgi:hypothetical protein